MRKPGACSRGAEDREHVLCRDGRCHRRGAGERYVARQGRIKVRDADVFTLDDVGLDKRRLHEARKLRNVVREQPDFVERVIAAVWTPGLIPAGEPVARNRTRTVRRKIRATSFTRRRSGNAHAAALGKLLGDGERTRSRQGRDHATARRCRL
ncbi:hypothetical protein F2981_02615 [Sinorhizobium meliloti]|nr:hypothetical protein [Sinorhizobium meliloti]